MKNDFYYVVSRSKMIDNLNHEFNEYIEIFSTSNEKTSEFLSLTVCIRLHRRHYHLFSDFKTTYFSFRSNAHYVRKQRDHVDAF